MIIPLDKPTITPAQWKTFFGAIANGYSVSAACRRAKVSRATVYRYKQEVPTIAYRWQQALGEGDEYYEDTARKRAVDGVTRERGVYYEGVRVDTYTETRYSDTLLLAILGARMPEKYGAGAQERVKQLVVNELNKVVDHLSRTLPRDVFDQVLGALATEGVIDVDAINSASAIETTAGDSND